MFDLLKRPTAFLPMLISGGFLVTLGAGLAAGTLARRPDEDTGAHLFQILMPLQFLLMLYFASVWLPKQPKAAGSVLAVQAGLAAAVLAIVYARHL